MFGKMKMYTEYVMTRKEINNFVRSIPKLSYNGDKERFKQVILDGYYTQYLVSSYGRVISTEYRGFKDKIAVLKMKVRSNGYHDVTLTIKSKFKSVLVHRLVGFMFIKNPNPKLYTQINHIDGNKVNNHISNLEWCSPKQNISHLYKIGLKKNILKGESIADSIYTERQVRKVCELLEEGMLPLKEIAKRTGVSYDMVRNVKLHHNWKHISCDYNIDNYAKYYERSINKKLPLIHIVCKMLESGEYTVYEISDKTGVECTTILNVLNGHCFKNISKLYNINNYKIAHHKKKGITQT